MQNTISLPVISAPVAPGGQGGAVPPAQATPPNLSAEPAQAKTRDKISESLTPKARAALEKALAKRQATPAAKPTAAATPPDPAKPNAGTGGATPPAAAEAAPTPTAKPGDEGKGDEEPDAGVIDFLKLGEAKEAKGEETLPQLTEAELADIAVVKTKLTEAHQDNAKLRKQRREATEAKAALEQEKQDLQKQLDAARAAAQTQGSSSRYLDRFSKVEEIQAARDDAVATLRQLQEDPERESVLLPGGRVWKLVEGETDHSAQAAQMALDILDHFDAKAKQLQDRSSAEKQVEEKLPNLVKMLPGLDKAYRDNLGQDWSAKAPELSLSAAIGSLVMSGEYVMVPRGKAAPKAAAAPAVKPAPVQAGELPNNTPPARAADGKAASEALKKKALGGDKQALSAWIRGSGKTKESAT